MTIHIEGRRWFQKIMLFHDHTYRAGEHGYYEPLSRGRFEVYEDSKRYVYRKDGRSISEIKRALRAAFESGNHERKIRGAYPSYTCE